MNWTILHILKNVCKKGMLVIINYNDGTVLLVYSPAPSNVVRYIFLFLCEEAFEKHNQWRHTEDKTEDSQSY